MCIQLSGKWGYNNCIPVGEQAKFRLVCSILPAKKNSAQK